MFYCKVDLYIAIILYLTVSLLSLCHFPRMTVVQPRPQGLSLKKWKSPGGREKPRGRGWPLYKGLTVLHFRSLTEKWGFCWWFLWSLPGCSSWWRLAALRFTLFIVRNWSRKLTACEMILLWIQTQRADSGTRAVVERESIVRLSSSAVPFGVIPWEINALNMKPVKINLFLLIFKAHKQFE